LAGMNQGASLQNKKRGWQVHCNPRRTLLASCLRPNIGQAIP
jgi:hypothetical protein